MLATTVSLVDIAMVGRLGPHTLAAVGYVTQIFLLTQAVLFAVGTAGVALMARAHRCGRSRARARGARELARRRRARRRRDRGPRARASRAVLARALDAKPEVIDAALPYLRLAMTSTLLLAVSITLECGFRAAATRARRCASPSS